MIVSSFSLASKLEVDMAYEIIYGNQKGKIDFSANICKEYKKEFSPSYIPNTFIPDGDGVNDSFVPITDFDIYEWEFSIFNRWGNLIFVNTDVDSSWDGYVDGEKVEDGTYIYTLKYKSCANPIETKMIQGFVNVLR